MALNQIRSFSTKTVRTKLVRISFPFNLHERRDLHRFTRERNRLLLSTTSLVPTADSNSSEPRLPSGARKSKMCLPSAHSEYCVSGWRGRREIELEVLILECIRMLTTQLHGIMKT